MPTYKERTDLIKWMMKKSGASIEIMVGYLNCGSKQYFNNKCHRNSFSIDDLILAAHACGFDILLTNKDGTIAISLDPSTYFGEGRTDIRERIKTMDEKTKDWREKHAEYEQLKARLKQMKEEYGF